MKRLLLVLTLGAALGSPAFAQSTNTPPSGPPPHEGGWGMKFLTPEEQTEYKTDRDAALKADSSLATEDTAIRAQMKANHEAGTPPTADQMAQGKAFNEKLDAAMIAADANVAPIIAKIKAHHHHHDGAGGPPPPPANQ